MKKTYFLNGSMYFAPDSMFFIYCITSFQKNYTECCQQQKVWAALFTHTHTHRVEQIVNRLYQIKNKLCHV